MRTILLLAVCLVGSVVGAAVAQMPSSESEFKEFAVLPETVPTPKENPTSAGKVALGKQLFFDPRLSQTAPYMHDGSLKTLEDVVTFYYRNVPTTAPNGSSIDVESLLGNSFTEIPDVVAFLKSLSGAALEVSPPELP